MVINSVLNVFYKKLNVLLCLRYDKRNIHRRKVCYILAPFGYPESEIDRLKERLAKYENPKNSKNSSKPPSSDFPKPQRIQSLREPSGKKPG